MKYLYEYDLTTADDKLLATGVTTREDARTLKRYFATATDAKIQIVQKKYKLDTKTVVR